MTHDIYRVNGPRVIFEHIDGELILVHMERGTYYTTDEVGAELWSLIEAGRSGSEMWEALRSRYDASPEEIAQAVSAFLARLQEEDLISPEASPNGRAARPPAPSEANGPRRPFRPPVLQSYRDMQDMLSLDPIHDVEAAGWPVPKLGDDPPLVSESA